ncbi:hypothetical protein K2173_024167 [Erythroxylum novogranatense]|uniref:Retrotransposon Copia-like N-terminal domain-containing protein n=1 Tax=Erythroxylum novogranatense TaxID=1862640 RepID=A0AAV8UFN8_9ROSI|nr:hypothetical protein K2173_024167 [Erythroxylum novogranatense]
METSSSNSIIPAKNPTPNNQTSSQIIIQQENSVFPTNVILDETNYSLWSQLMEMRIGACNKIGYLNGEAKKLAHGDPDLATWVAKNSKVKCWLIDSMSPSLMQRFVRLPTAKDIWEVVSKMFYDGSDETCIFDLNQRSFSTKQTGRPLATYYNELVAIFQEIDHRTISQEGTTEGVVQMHSAMARLRVHIFLNGLDSKFYQVHREILRKDPNLDLESTYAYLRREYQQRQTMGNSRSIPESTHAKSMNLHCDNKAAIEITQNPVQHDCTKHVKVDIHFIKEKVDQKFIQLPFVHSEGQLADILTKAISGKVFHGIINKLGMIDIYPPT